MSLNYPLTRLKRSTMLKQSLLSSVTALRKRTNEPPPPPKKKGPRFKARPKDQL